MVLLKAISFSTVCIFPYYAFFPTTFYHPKIQNRNHKNKHKRSIFLWLFAEMLTPNVFSSPKNIIATQGG